MKKSMTMTIEQGEQIKQGYERIRDELSKAIVGQTGLIKSLFVCLLCGGHALIEGVPGLGKTLIVKSFSRLLTLKYSRIQFTPDLMPADILGTNIVNQDVNGNRFFEFYKGPIFGQVILADEINRASPKTQSALLEAMQEERVTIFGKEYSLTPPFMVLATQNPLEMEGTYPLPEAQIDRFFFKLKVEYPSPDQIEEILKKTTEDYEPLFNNVLDGDSIVQMKRLVKQVPIASHIQKYAVRLVLATHPENRYAVNKTKAYIRFGASPRAAQALVMAGKVMALLHGRYNVDYEDIREVAESALRHRIILNLKGAADAVDTDNIIRDLLRGVPEKVRA
jgi:MoxR-like ATPase